MRILVKLIVGQSPKRQLLLLLALCFVLLNSCSGRRDSASVIPPLTSPLSNEYIGFGVVNASYIQVAADPLDEGTSLGYLRRGSLVRILRRQAVRSGNNFVSWVLIEGDQKEWGWLREDVLTIYPNERQAITASESMSR